MALSYSSRTAGVSFSGLPGGAAVGVAMAVCIATFGAVISTAPIYVAFSGIALAAIIFLLWRHDDPPILLLPPLYQWSEVAIVPISTIWKRGDLNDLSYFGANLETSAVYGLLGVVSLAVGLRLAMGSGRAFNKRLSAEARRFEFGSVARLALALMAAGYTFAAMSRIAGPARELFHQTSDIKYVGLFILTYWCLIRRQHLKVLAAVIGVEIIIGLTGYFAEFKDATLTVFVAALAARPRLKSKDMVVVGLSLSLLLAVATFWSAIKVDYRFFVNRGTGAQVVLVPLGDQLDYLVREVATFDGSDLAAGVNRLIDRHGYIDFLAEVMETVPAVRPHENGALTGAIIQHITMPRFLFPEKPPLPNDTEVMARYTGQAMMWDRHTSISIGHLAELYVDFGYVGGLVGMLVIGFVLGTVYRVLRAHRGIPALVTAGLCLTAALPVAYFGTAYAKLVGALVFSSAIALAVQRIGVPILLASRAFRLRKQA